MPRLTPPVSWLSTVPGGRQARFRRGTRAENPAPSAQEIQGGPRLARAITLAVLLAYVAVEVIDLASAPTPPSGAELAAELGCLAALCALTATVTSAAAERWTRRRRLAMLAAEALITYLPLVILGRDWADEAGFFAGSALLLLSGWAAWTLFAAVVASIPLVPVVADQGAYGTAHLALSTLVIGLVVFGLARLSLAVRIVHATRGELAQLAVINERMRFARDLHDLLGYSLSAITLKAQLSRQLVDSDPARADDELGEVHDIARQALADVRIVASGYRNISLAKEATSVTSLLATASISAQVDVATGALDEQVDTVLATILREAVTNMLTHSAVRHCVIKADVAGDTVRLQVRNDGVTGPGGSRGRPGGLDNLRARLEAIGGTLTVEARGDGWFALSAAAPLEPGPAPGGAHDGAGLRWRRRQAGRGPGQGGV